MTGPIAKFEDRTLIEMSVAGHSEGFSVLMERHGTAVRRCIGAVIRDRSDVEDLVQDTFLKAWCGLSAFRFEASFRTWITSVAINEALGLHRRRRCRPFCLPSTDFETVRSSCDSPEQALTSSEAQRRVRRAIASLPQKYREILTLCELEELSRRQAARHLKSSISLVKSRLFRARRMLCAALNRKAANCYAADEE
jgi:RNA polymerase sigma-70 factor, ECF subfamily